MTGVETLYQTPEISNSEYVRNILKTPTGYAKASEIDALQQAAKMLWER